MAATPEAIRKRMKVSPTTQDKGLTLTITVTAYDRTRSDGQKVYPVAVQVDGTPMSGGPDETWDWLLAAQDVLMTLAEFRTMVTKRREERRS